jgi:FAD/FMN-containing dehydrogenase/Fe-S oxidoreductase
MDPAQRDNIHDDLKGILKGEILFDDLSRALYSTDASIFQIQPLGIVIPRDEEDVQSLVRYAAEHQLPLIPRGAGTGLAGESLGSGLTVDLSRHFRGMGELQGDTIRVQPGVVYRDLNVRLAPAGRRFAPDLTSGVHCTIGGMLATNASGANALRHGYTRDHVAELRLVVNTGDCDWVGQVPRRADVVLPTGRFLDIAAQVCALLEDHAEVIQTCRPRTRFDRCGYLLHDVLTPDSLDLARLLVGSEGTLALFTEARLRTIPMPGGRSAVLFGFSSLDAAIRASQQALPSEPAACELMDRRLLTLARSRGTDRKAIVPAEAEAVLLVAYEAETPREAKEAALEIVDQLQWTQRLALYAMPAFETDETERLWNLHEQVLPSLYAIRGGPQPVAFVEDVAVPPEDLGVYLHGVQEILQRYETTASFLVHAGTGQVHTRPFLDLNRPDEVSRLWALAEAIHSLALDLGGTVSSQHGTGLARTPWVARQYGRLYPVLRELKTIFDPHQLFNPGKIIGPNPDLPAWPLRRAPPAAAELPQRILHWQPGEVRSESVHCNGCGQCRTEAPAQRMCPMFRVTHSEEATPRAKANLLRHLLQEGTDPRTLASEEVRAVADLCVNCRMCAHECPAHVNIPKLMLEAKAANTAEYGLSRTNATLARTESYAALGSLFARVVNAGLSNRALRWVLERFFGVSHRRLLPTFAARSFLRRAERRGWTRRLRGRNRPRAAYFVDVFANYNDPQLAEAVVAILHHNGVEVYVPPGQRGCGMAALAHGDVETARESAVHNLRIFADLAREGYPIICSEPTAALMLQQDYVNLVEGPDARLVADQVVELTSFLWDLHQQGRLRTDFQPLDLALGHHVPCHLKALGKPTAGPSLLALIPGVRVTTIDVSCSGMAGTFGLGAQNYEMSLSAGEPMLRELGRLQALFGSTECSTCRLQMEDGSGKRTLHPAQYLALAYGLMPELARRLRQPSRKLVVQ